MTGEWHLEIGMNLVACDRHAMVKADFPGEAQFSIRPCPSDGIVRIAEKKQLDTRVGDLALKIVEVHLVCEIAVTLVLRRDASEWTFQHLASLIADRPEKAVVNGRLDDHLVPWDAKRADCRGERRYDAGCVEN